MIQPSPQCNGYRDWDWETRAGTVELRTEAEEGSAGPLLEPRRTAEKALTAIIQKAHVQGFSTRSLNAQGHGHERFVEDLGLAAVRPALIPCSEFS